MKNVYRVNTEQPVNIKSGISRSKNATILKLDVLVHCLARTYQSPVIPTDT